MATKPNAFLTIAIIYASLIMGVVLFGVITIFVLQGPDQPQNELESMGFAAIILSIVVPAGGMFFYSKKIISVKDEPPSNKLAQWRVATLVRAASIEAPALFCVVNIILSGADIFLYLYVALLVLMIFNFPTKSRMLNELQIAEEDLNVTG